jgi:lycopene cyclase domain-containing protein
MKEYTLLAVGSALCMVLLDRWLGTYIMRRKEFWITIAVMFFFKIPSNGYLTWRPIVQYNPDMFLGFRLGTIPLEDFFYGFGLIALTLILWEKLKRERNTHEV